jgi:hypothetical protein
VFDYEWISLLDSVRSAAAVTSEERGRVRALMAADEIKSRILLIDRVDAGNAVISKGLADECYLSIAVAILTSDAAFPPADGSGVPLFVDEPQDGAVIPIALVNLHHPVGQVRSAISDHIRLQLAEASLERPTARWSPDVQTLDTLADLEVKEIASGSFSPRGARERRERSASELLRVILATRGRDTSGRDQLDRAVARINQSLPEEQAPVPQTAALGLVTLSPSTSVGLITLAVAIVGAAIHWRKRRQTPNASAALALGHATDSRGVGEARRQWGELRDRLGALAAEMSRELRLHAVRTAGEPTPTWARTGTSPFDWNLVRDPLPRTDVAPLTDHEYSELAQRCLQLLGDGHATEAVLDQAIERLAEERLRKSSHLATAVVRAAFSEGHALPIKASLGSRDTALLASTPANSIGDVYWVGDKRVVVCDELKSLEPADTRNLVRCAAHDDPERTTRLAFGRPIPWQTVISLSSIGL